MSGNYNLFFILFTYPKLFYFPLLIVTMVAEVPNEPLAITLSKEEVNQNDMLFHFELS